MRRRTALQPVARGQVHDHQADGAEEQRPLQVEGAVGEAAVAEHPRGRAGREDHHRAEGEQAEGRGEQHVVLGRQAGGARALLRLRLPCAFGPGPARAAARALIASSPTISRKRSPRRSKFSKASKLAQAGESRTTSPGRAAAAARRTASSRSAQRCSSTPAATPARARRRAGRRWRRSGSRRRSARAPGRAAARTARPSRCRRGSRGRRPRRRAMPDRPPRRRWSPWSR